ncbi:4-hydroxyphenylpyruvate dioxygenase [Amycolatopsis taiwanensis]|uniref:4-hydroxyphenylpyruvate dioxygenase n=1 Tax=Amycolatopsis taiwanensis TaxID=342230 RepID=A0A9W6VK28_9PSEU|nr:4-hydroxyphenylpyruvate dioxygenase [Amycolatopsis taiwanensis]GLY70042.1 4-hydroxyphenylpyruvate dioxygenase [Amycolatopsis taiwanensis]
MPGYDFRDLTLDHVELYVDDVTGTAAALSDAYGFGTYAASGFPDGRVSDSYSVALGTDRIRLVLRAAQTDDHPGRAYVRAHGDGVCDIAMRVDDVAATFAEAVRRGARPVAEPVAVDGMVTATIGGFGDVVHTLVQRPAEVDPRVLPGFAMLDRPGPPGVGLHEMDHFAVCVEAGRLDDTVAYYERALGFEMIFTERITVGAQAMDSKVVQSAGGTVTLTILEPDPSASPGQIDDFLKSHRGPGVQHIAFTSENIVASVDALRDRGIELLATPDSYYDLVARRIELSKHSVAELRRLSILVDEDHDGQLFQIFARSAHPRRTFFFEIIERCGATTFGSGNIRALYEAVELQDAKVAE